MSRTIVVGDIHGCLEEFEEVLRVAEFKQGIDVLVLAGDLVDRGPDSLGVVRKARELGALGVMGNHEEKHIRYRMHENRKASRPGYVNPIGSFSSERIKEHRLYSDDDMDWMAMLPVFLDIGKRWNVVHAGLDPQLSFDKQDRNILLRCRFLSRETGKMIKLNDDESNADFWADLWKGPERVIYGHHVTGDEIRVTNSGDDILCVGIDTGCCFGGSLTAIQIVDGEFSGKFSVTAKQQYVKRNNYSGVV